jgi:DNA repair exonuclease SbcCD ATPase subunit
MKLRELRIAGFGRISDRAIAFGPRLNIVVGPNEAGKSTLAAAIVASLYGLARGEKDRWRPWASDDYATVLSYETSDGSSWEVQRSYDRDSKGVRLYDAAGNDVAGKVGNGKSLAPGEAHLQIPLDVFLQTACIRQGSVAFDSERADAVSTSLAQALDGGPKEDAAIGAIERLDAALRKHVGTQRAHKNNPLRKLRDDETKQRDELQAARAALESLAKLRESIVDERVARDRGLQAAAEIEQRLRALRAAHLRSRLDALKEHRAELATLQSAKASYDDVAAFPSERLDRLDETYRAWQVAEATHAEAQEELASTMLDEDDQDELEERRRDVGRLDNAAFLDMNTAYKQVEASQAKAEAAGAESATARAIADESATPANLLMGVTGIAILADAGLLIGHEWLYAIFATVAALLLGISATKRSTQRAELLAEADTKQRIAEAALLDKAQAERTVAQVLGPLGIASAEELAGRWERLAELAEREGDWGKARERATKAHVHRTSLGAQFDVLANELVPDVEGTRAERRDVALLRAARRREREGLDASFAMLSMRGNDILLGDDERELRAELEQLLADGVVPAPADDPAQLRTLTREHNDVRTRAHEADLRLHTLEGELHSAEQRVADIAGLEETLAFTQRQIERLEGFERAVGLARTTIDQRKDEAHSLFARRLEQYSLDMLALITGGRYGQIFLDPATLAINVRIPETGQIEPLDRLSTGTRDQIALVVRFATARMFAEGLETPPLLLDDPFAFWDPERIERCLPVLAAGAQDAQTIVFTSSRDLAREGQAAGATIVDLAEKVTAPA